MTRPVCPMFGRTWVAARTTARRSIPLLTALTATACDGAPPASGPGTPSERPPAAWSIPAEPEFDLTSVAVGGDSVPLFMIEKAAIGSDGVMAVGVRGGSTETVVLLDGDGEGLRRIGRAGEGPGEFRSISGLFMTDDRVVVWDLRSRRISVFDRTGRLHEMFGIDRVARVLGPASDGGVLLDRAVEQPSGPDVRSFEIDVGGDDPVRVLESVREPVESSFQFDYMADGRPIGMWTNLPSECLPQLYAAAVGDGIVLADASEGRLWSVGVDGVRQELLRRDERPVVTSAAHDRVRSWFERLEASARGPRPDPSGRMVAPAEVEFPTEPLDSALGLVGEMGDPLAVWDRLLADPSGRIWLREAECRRSPDARRWTIVDLDGHEVGSLDVPSAVRVLAVRGSRMVATYWDDLDVEHLLVYELEMA